jgi:hypothetical protein
VKDKMTKTLTQRLEEEGNRIATLDKALEEGKLPSEEVAKQMSVEDIYGLAARSAEFDFRLNLELVKSGHYFVQMVNQYIEECESGARIPDPWRIEDAKEIAKVYAAEVQDKTELLVKHALHNYDHSK